MQRVCKRIIDVAFSLLAIVLLSPLLIMIALLILIRDGRPVFFRQKRVGKHNRVFEIFKFRTMRVIHDDPVISDSADWKNGVPDDFVFKSAYNPETTKLGEWLRKYSFDELPQFFNVLKGEMSIVGPRPEIPDIARCYNHMQSRRLLVKPGITGLAQVSGRSELWHGEKINYDLEYVENWSLWGDLQIIFKTAIIAFCGKGAF